MAGQALALLEELAQKPVLSRIERDAAIQRFEYTFECVWKAAQLFLREIEGLQAGSPKQAARLSMQAGLLDEGQTRLALQMTDDRNETVHTYNEQLAQDIAGRLAQHAELLRTWLERLIARS